MEIPATALLEIAHSAERAPTKGDPVPISVAERWGNPGALAPELKATVEEPPSRAAAPAADPVSDGDEGPVRPSHAVHATYAGRDPYFRAGGFLLVVVFVAVAAAAAAAYWMSVDTTRLPDRQTMADGRSTATDSGSKAAAGGTQNAYTPDPSPSADRLPSAGPLPLSAGSPESQATAGEPISPSEEPRPSKEASSEAPATVRESIPPDAGAEPPAAPQVPGSADAQTPSRAKAGESVADGTAKTSHTTETNDPRRVATKGRTKAQAERDATETRRLIARELAVSRPANSDDRKPPPGP